MSLLFLILLMDINYSFYYYIIWIKNATSDVF